MCKWISVKDELPDNSRIVLIVVRHYIYDTDSHVHTPFLASYISEHDEDAHLYRFKNMWCVKDSGGTLQDAMYFKSSVEYWMDIPNIEE